MNQQQIKIFAMVGDPRHGDVEEVVLTIDVGESEHAGEFADLLAPLIKTTLSEACAMFPDCFELKHARTSPRRRPAAAALLPTPTPADPAGVGDEGEGDEARHAGSLATASVLTVLCPNDCCGGRTIPSSQVRVDFDPHAAGPTRRRVVAYCDACNNLWQEDQVLQDGEWRAITGTLERVTDKQRRASIARELDEAAGVIRTDEPRPRAPSARHVAVG